MIQKSSVIKSFKDAMAKALFYGESPKGFPADLVKVARRKLRYVDAATDLRDLKALPGNNLHALEGKRAHQHAIWINRQYRVVFTWTKEGPTGVEVTDYHDDRK
jgi:proteic killer suppression protein